MATSGYAVKAFSGRPGYDVILEVWRADQDPWSTKWSWRLTARRWDSYLSWTGNAGPWSVNVEGFTWSGSHSLRFDQASQIVIGSGTTNWVNHDANGYLTVNFSFSFTNDFFGTAAASSSFAANRIPQEPGPPPAPVYTGRTPNSLTFNIFQPTDNGGSAVQTYEMRVRAYPSGSPVIATWQSGSSSQTTPPVLDANTKYIVDYRAKNAIGWGPYSGTNHMTTAVGKPSAPLNPTIENLAPTSLDLVWEASASDGGSPITEYTVQRSLDENFTLGVVTYSAGTALSMDFDDLEPSTSYWFRVSATNPAGAGNYSTIVQATTVSGVYYSNGTTWLPCGVYRSDGTNWIPVELFVSNGTAWIAAN